MLSLTIQSSSFHSQLINSHSVFVAFFFFYSGLLMRRCLSHLLRVLSSPSTNDYVFRKTGEYASLSKTANLEPPKTDRRFRAAISLFIDRTESTVCRKPFCANWLLAAIHKQNAKSTRRSQSPRLHESFPRHHDSRTVRSKSSSSSSHALSTTLPWTIKLSLAVLWVGPYTFPSGISLIYFRVSVGCSTQLGMTQLTSTNPPQMSSIRLTGTRSNDHTRKYLTLISQQVRGHRIPTQPFLTLTPIGEYFVQPTDELAGPRFQEQVSDDVSTLGRGAAWSRGRNLRSRGESENVLARRQTPLASGRVYQGMSHESFQVEFAGRII